MAPIEWARWLVTALATVLSTLTLCAAFFGALREDMKKGLPVLIGIGAVHVALGLVYKLYFFAKIKLPPASDEK